jgi:hypothetical protein
VFHAGDFRGLLPLCAALGLSVSLTPPAWGAASPDVHPAPAPHVLVKEDLEAFFDGIIPLQLERSDVAGATVLVMRSGETLLQKGYGFPGLQRSSSLTLSCTPSHCLASAGASFFSLMTGHFLASSALSSLKFS